jgi:hypothetical protein
MPGNPGKQGRTSAAYQMGRRRLTKVPGYHSVLPRVFPMVWRGTLEDAGRCVNWLIESGSDGFAVTSHPSTLDGHVHLWLSVNCAESLVIASLIRQESLEISDLGRQERW